MRKFNDWHGSFGGQRNDRGGKTRENLNVQKLWYLVRSKINIIKRYFTEFYFEREIFVKSNLDLGADQIPWDWCEGFRGLSCFLPPIVLIRSFPRSCVSGDRNGTFGALIAQSWQIRHCWMLCLEIMGGDHHRTHFYVFRALLLERVPGPIESVPDRLRRVWDRFNIWIFRI